MHLSVATLCLFKLSFLNASSMTQRGKYEF